MNWIKRLVEKLSRKSTPELTIDDYDRPVLIPTKHKFMDGNQRKRLVTKAWAQSKDKWGE